MPTEQRNANPENRPGDMVTFVNPDNARLAVPYYHIIGVEYHPDHGNGRVVVTAGGYSIQIHAPNASSIFDDITLRKRNYFSCLKVSDSPSDPDQGVSIRWTQRSDRG